MNQQPPLLPTLRSVGPRTMITEPEFVFNYMYLAFCALYAATFKKFRTSDVSLKIAYERASAKGHFPLPVWFADVAWTCASVFQTVHGIYVVVVAFWFTAGDQVGQASSIWFYFQIFVIIFQDLWNYFFVWAYASNLVVAGESPKNGKAPKAGWIDYEFGKKASIILLEVIMICMLVGTVMAYVFNVAHIPLHSWPAWVGHMATLQALAHLYYPFTIALVIVMWSTMSWGFMFGKPTAVVGVTKEQVKLVKKKPTTQQEDN